MAAACFNPYITGRGMLTAPFLRVVLEWVKRVPKHRASQGMTGGTRLQSPTYAAHLPRLSKNRPGFLPTLWFVGDDAGIEDLR